MDESDDIGKIDNLTCSFDNVPGFWKFRELLSTADSTYKQSSFP